MRTTSYPPAADLTITVLARLKAAHRTLTEAYLGYPAGIHQRLARAMELLTTDTQYTITADWNQGVTPARYIYAITKIERGQAPITYTVDLTEERSCTCPDQEKTRVCKHSLAVRLLIMSEQE